MILYLTEDHHTKRIKPISERNKSMYMCIKVVMLSGGQRRPMGGKEARKRTASGHVEGYAQYKIHKYIFKIIIFFNDTTKARYGSTHL